MRLSHPLLGISGVLIVSIIAYSSLSYFDISHVQSCLVEVRIDDETCFAPNAAIVSGDIRHPISEMRKNPDVTNRMLKGTYMPYREGLSSGILGGVAWTSEGELDYRLKLERISPLQYRIVEISELWPNDPIFRKAFLGGSN